MYKFTPNTTFWYLDSAGVQQSAQAHMTNVSWAWDRQFNTSVGRRGQVSYPIRRMQSDIIVGFIFPYWEDKYYFLSWIQSWQVYAANGFMSAVDDFPFLKMQLDVNGDQSKLLYYGVLFPELNYTEAFDDLAPTWSTTMNIARDTEDYNAGDWSWTNIASKTVASDTVKSSGESAFE